MRGRHEPYHHVALIEKLDGADLRLRYAQAAIEDGWSRDVLLKVGDFDPSYLGQLGTYMAAVDDLLRHPNDKPTIGLLLCKTKNNVIAEYALRGYAPIGVAEWKTAITESLPAELESSLPAVEELEAELADEPGSVAHEGEDQ
ncbi:PDDEXK nuclease domain-containing protein [Candidatus Mycobacterium methanotrophicum]|uniref:PDDEXK nuclease domain-containing protein n=1 Tax=Candidatus Mycobacterium methanotrophicum TaxID=2943498 RepID=A0ABY4QJL5_9MYCO|nr:PDDEXK nuclease domain-containing protein [Candidatus Mycobacterium methanotrophicum]UQX10186.1 PDDEXK nuclease domain-containing protein [Candidatus Mycobacterium methanotrophicum]